MTRSRNTNLLLSTCAFLVGCAATGGWHAERMPAPGERLPRIGDEIVVCGQLFHTGTPVVLWNDVGGYDGYRARRRFAKPKDGEAEADKARYGQRDAPNEEIAARVRARGWSLDDLRETVDQFVVHFDVCGTSRRCFTVLEGRDLSVHFLLDMDGTIYQTLDLRERAWHASHANTRAVGIEIAHIGAYPAPGHPTLRQWYEVDELGPKITPPKWIGMDGVRTENFVGRPARSELIEGAIRGKRLWQYDFTDEQYRALAKLVATLHVALPSIELDGPRGASGEILMRTLTEGEFAAFGGMLGHFHVQKNKTDPGPAFDWGRVLAAARAAFLPVRE